MALKERTRIITPKLQISEISSDTGFVFDAPASTQLQLTVNGTSYFRFDTEDDVNGFIFGTKAKDMRLYGAALYFNDVPIGEDLIKISETVKGLQQTVSQHSLNFEFYQEAIPSMQESLQDALDRINSLEESSDLSELLKRINTLSTTLTNHINNKIVHITAAERDRWNGYAGGEIEMPDDDGFDFEISEQGLQTPRLHGTLKEENENTCLRDLPTIDLYNNSVLVMPGYGGMDGFITSPDCYGDAIPNLRMVIKYVDETLKDFVPGGGLEPGEEPDEDIDIFTGIVQLASLLGYDKEIAGAQHNVVTISQGTALTMPEYGGMDAFLEDLTSYGDVIPNIRMVDGIVQNALKDYTPGGGVANPTEPETIPNVVTWTDNASSDGTGVGNGKDGFTGALIVPQLASPADSDEVQLDGVIIQKNSIPTNENWRDSHGMLTTIDMVKQLINDALVQLTTKSESPTVATLKAAIMPVALTVDEQPVQTTQESNAKKRTKRKK